MKQKINGFLNSQAQVHLLAVCFKCRYEITWLWYVKYQVFIRWTVNKFHCEFLQADSEILFFFILWLKSCNPFPRNDFILCFPDDWQLF